MTHSF